MAFKIFNRDEGFALLVLASASSWRGVTHHDSVEQIVGGRSSGARIEGMGNPRVGPLPLKGE
jgi:hypothetical protein